MPERRRILHVFSGDQWAGAEAVVSALFESLVGDPDVELVALSLNHGTLSSRLARLGYEVHIIPEAQNSFASISAAAWAHFRGRAFHVVHSHRAKQNVLAFLLARGLRVPRLVTTLHGMPEQIPGHPSDRLGERIKHAVDSMIIARAFTTIVPVSSEIEERLRSRIPKGRLVCIRNGIRIPAPAPAARPAGVDGCHIGSVGRLVHVKDFDLFLRTAAEVLKTAPRTRFSILGGGPLRGALLDRARTLSIEERLAIVPPVEDPMPFYRSLDVYLNTSHHEGIAMSILEAMACERPIVAPRVGGIPEIVEEGDSGQGLLVPLRAPAELARRCLDLLGDPAKRTAMGRRGRERVDREFSASKMAGAYKRLYLEMDAP